jgi:hypothetical protein
VQGVSILGIWLTVACVLGLVVAWVPPTIPKPGARILALLQLYALLVASSLVAIFVVARSRTEAVQVEYRGVKMSNTDHLAVGVGDDSLDVSLENGAGRTRPWSVKFTKADSGWLTLPRRAPEELLVSVRASSFVVRVASTLLRISYWEPMSGVVLRPDVGGPQISAPVALLDSASGDSRRLALNTVSSSTRATIGKHSWIVEESGDPLPFRTQEQLQAGVYLSELRQKDSSSSPPVADFVRLRRLRWSERIGEAPSFESLLGAVVERLVLSIRFALPRAQVARFTRYVASTTAPVSLGDRPGTVVALSWQRGSTDIQARSGGETWRFTWQPDQTGAIIEFVRRPKGRRFPLTAAGACPLAAACNIASLKRVPLPSSQLLLSEGGLDSTRFELFGRLSSEQSGVWYFSGDARTAISEREPGTWLLAKRLGPTIDKKAPLAAINLIARRGPISASWDILLVAAGVVCSLFYLYFLVRAAVARGTAFAGSIDERTLAVAVNGLLALALARLILGIRVDVFPPFAARGVETAIGLWISFEVAMTALLLWRSWFPILAQWHSQGTAAVAREFISWLKVRQVRSQTRRANPRARFGWLLALSLFVFALISWQAMLAGVLVGGVIAVMWSALALAVLGAIPTDATAAARCREGPWGALETRLPFVVSTADGKRRLTYFGLILFVAWMSVMIPAAFALLTVAIAFAGRFAGKATGSTARFVRTAIVLGLPPFILTLLSSSHSAAALSLALVVGLFVIRGAASLRQDSKDNAPFGGIQIGVDLVWALLPMVLLIPLLLTDVGLFLIVLVPIVLAGYVASGVFRSSRTRGIVAGAIFTSMLASIGWQLIAFPTDIIANAPATEVDAQLRGMERLAHLERFPPFRRSLANVASRGLAAKSQSAAERALAISGPSETRDFLLRAIEQEWGTRAYAAGGLAGSGLGESPVGGRGVAEAVAYAENSFSVFVLSEHGAIGGCALLLCYFMVVLGIFLLLLRRPDLLVGNFNYTMRALLFLTAGLIALPACYVGLSNVGVLPITGQNMPFIGLNGWSDVVFCTGIVSFFLIAALRLNSEAVGAVSLGVENANNRSSDNNVV